jgi:RND family efflux transporter MFP subunit
MLRRRLVAFALVSGLPLVLAACGEETHADPRTEAPQVQTATVQAAPSSARAFTGIVAARVQSDMGFRVPGKVLERLVDAGQSVKRGQLLLRIDPVDLRLAANAQQEAVAAAGARAQQTAREEARYRDLVGTGAVSASAYDQAKATADAAKAQLSAALAEADVSHNATRYSELVADADGVVTETLAEPGQVVSAGQTVVRLAHAGRREAVVQLPETLHPAIGSRAQATLFGGGASVTAELRQLGGSADRLTRTFEARYVLEGDLADAPLGATVTLRIPDTRDAGATDLQVPIGALLDSGKGAGLWIVHGEPAQVSWRPVSVLRLDEDSARVAGALRQGDRIVALGAQLLREGESVRTTTRAIAVANDGGRP